MNIHSHKVSSESCCAEGDHGGIGAACERQPSADSIDRSVRIFSALADPTRLRILHALADGELCVCDLAAVAGISQSGASHQLRLLRDRGLVAFRREGQRAIYRLADDHVRTLLAQGLEHAEEENR